MNVNLKKLRDQVIVITGASSGIGLVTAKIAAQRGAKVVLTGRDEEALGQVTREIRNNSGDAAYVVGDVADETAMQRIAKFTLDQYGRFDSWINNAGVHIFGMMEKVPLQDARRLFETNYWGVVHGCRVAVPFLKKHGGALINIGSVLSSRSVPLQGHYGASKHAVQGYTDALRTELKAEGAPVSVTLIKPAAIDTPIPMHSKNFMAERSRLPFPLHAPELAAEAILFCTEHPRRHIIVGGAGVMAVMGEKYFPILTDLLMKLFMFRMQKTRGDHREVDGLHSTPDHAPRARGDHNFYAAERSVYLSAAMHPVLTTAALAGAAAAAVWKRR
jgi:short-subunit dehydrogenase